MTRGQLPQRAGSLGLNGGGAAAAVHPTQHGVAVTAMYYAGTTMSSHDVQTISKYKGRYRRHQRAMTTNADVLSCWKTSI